MPKRKPTLLLIFLLIIILLFLVLIVRSNVRESQRQHLLSQLKDKGQIVFTRRDEAGVSNIWKINADGTGEVMLYKHSITNFPADSRFPQWLDEEDKIYFRSFDINKKPQIFEIDSNGQNVKLAEHPELYNNHEGVRQTSRASDIIIDKGDVYYTKTNNANGKMFLAYNYQSPYNIDFSPGAAEAAWGPNKEYIVFELDFGEIWITDKLGHSAKLTVGSEPDWK